MPRTKTVKAAPVLKPFPVADMEVETETPPGAPDDTPRAFHLLFAELLEFDPVGKLTRDIRDAAKMISPSQARFLVDAYYAMQRDRVRAGNQTAALGKLQEPNEVLGWLLDQRYALEKQVARALDAYSAASPVGAWARSITGIGPVIAAGLLANIDIEKAETVGSIWRFAGLDPTVTWEKGQKRPWNAGLKRLTYLIGESFVKVSNLESDTYGKVYKARKAREIEMNERGDFRAQAEAALAAKKYGTDTVARKQYEQGKLPDARVHRRAARYAVKLFLSAYHEAAYVERFGTLPPLPYILTRPEHTFYAGAPNKHMIGGWSEMSKKAAAARKKRLQAGKDEPVRTGAVTGSQEHVDHILRRDDVSRTA